MTEKPLPYGRQWIGEDDVAAVAAQLKDDWLTQGPRVAQFEEELCEDTGAKHGAAFSSETAALHLAALACLVPGWSSGSGRARGKALDSHGIHEVRLLAWPG